MPSIRTSAGTALLALVLSCSTEPLPSGPLTEFTISGVWGEAQFASDLASWYPALHPDSTYLVKIGLIAPGRAGASGFDNPGIDISAHLLRYDDCPPPIHDLSVGTFAWGTLGSSVTFARGTLRIDSGSVTFRSIGSFLTGTFDLWTVSDSSVPPLRLKGRFVAQQTEPCPA